jgi:homoserine O-succinyltransferase
MPIRIPGELPALEVLSSESIFVMDERRAVAQDIRPLEVGILNLMPNKIETEVQLLRLLSNTPLQINIDLIRIDDACHKNTPQSHMESFYQLFDDVASKKYDGLIVTGAPLAKLQYEEVKYWEKMCVVMDWARRHVQSTLFLCWAAHAAIYHFFGINRKLNNKKLFGVYAHKVNHTNDELVRGFDSSIYAPHSRYGEISIDDYLSVDGLRVMAESAETGAYLVASEDRRMVFITGHPEYDADTLDIEYKRDIKAGIKIDIPDHYYEHDDPSASPMVNWRAHGTLLFTNWLNYYVYQQTPFDLSELSV